MWKEVSRGTVASLELGQTVEGTLKEVREGSFGNIYDLQTKDGVQSIFGKALLDSKLSNIPVGKKVRITRLPDVKVKTGRVAQDFKVEVDE
jgi:hypothetical protein